MRSPVLTLWEVAVNRPETDALPPELEAAFTSEPAARAIFEALPPSHRREYLEWIRGGRTDQARERRAAQAILRLLDHAAKGKP